MTLILQIADAFRSALVPFLIAAASTWTLLIGLLVIQRGVASLAARRRGALERRFLPRVVAVLEGADAGAAAQLGRSGSRHRRLIGHLLLNAVGALAGAPVARAREMAHSLSLIDLWRTDLEDHRWWRRADAARAFGVVGEPSGFDRLIAALDDPHEEVRAAAVDALGRLHDIRAAAPLIARLSEQSRHQRVRIVDALRSLGPDAGPSLLAFAREHVDLLPAVSDLIAMACGASATDDLVGWLADARADVRAAALSALGSTGVDDRTFYHAIKALGDEDAGVRAMAARALGRSRRDDAAAYLGDRLEDEWEVAAHSARALAALSAAGRRVLIDRAEGDRPGAALARQMLWEIDARTGTVAPGAVGA